MSTPDSATSALTPVWELRFLICRSKAVGPQPVTLGGGVRRYTSLDPVHACQSYICKSAAEFEELQRQVVAKPEKSFFAAVELYNPDTKERRKITSDMRFTITQQDGQAVNSPGSYPGVAGSSPAPATSLKPVPFSVPTRLIEKQALIVAVQAADLQDPDWVYTLVEQIANPEAKGYLNACLSQLNETHDFSKQEFREAFLERVELAFPQTDKGTQSGGEQSPAVPESTLSASDTDAGTSEAAPEPETAPAPQSGESESEASEPESSAPRSARAPAPTPEPKRKPGRPAKK